MTREDLYAIIEQHVFVTDAWGGSKLANWQYGHEVMVAGIDDAVNAILNQSPNKAFQPTHEGAAK